VQSIKSAKQWDRVGWSIPLYQPDGRTVMEKGDFFDSQPTATQISIEAKA